MNEAKHEEENSLMTLLMGSPFLDKLQVLLLFTGKSMTILLLISNG